MTREYTSRLLLVLLLLSAFGGGVALGTSTGGSALPHGLTGPSAASGFNSRAPAFRLSALPVPISSNGSASGSPGPPTTPGLPNGPPPRGKQAPGAAPLREDLEGPVRLRAR